MSSERIPNFISPSSPRKRQFGFTTSKEVAIDSEGFSTAKRTTMDQDDMQDIWAELGGNVIDEHTEQMDYDDMLHNEGGLQDPLLPSLVPTTTARKAASSVSDGAGVPSTASAKTTPDSSNPFLVSPATSYYEPSPTSKESLLPITTAPSNHSGDSIAQMLEYMRACNNSQESQAPSSSFSHSISMESTPSQERRKEEENKGGRKKERSSSRGGKGRKQLSPIQKGTRSFSYSSDGNGVNPARSSLVALQQRARQKSNTEGKAGSTASSSSQQLGGEEDGETLRIDTYSAVKATGPSGAMRKHSITGKGRQRHPVSAGNDPWTASESSPTSSQSLAPIWPMERNNSKSSQNNKKISQENLSLSEFLKRPEGAMWFQHFQKSYPSHTIPTSAALESFNVEQQHRMAPLQQQQPTIASSGMPTPSIYSHMPPPPIDVAQMLGMQQAPNQALIQAFQTAFVLGMQQLGMAGHFQPTPSPLQAPQMQQQQYGYSWGHQQQQQQPTPPHNQDSLNRNATSSLHPSSAEVRETGDASSVLQSLLHDINQHRPNQQEFSVDEFLAFVANTVESTGDEQGSHEAGEVHKEEIREEKTGSFNRKARSTGSTGTETSEKKRSRRRTISISGQLNGTYLDDVVEDAVEGRKGVEHGEKEHGNREIVAHGSVEEEEDEEGDRGEGEGEEEGEEEDTLGIEDKESDEDRHHQKEISPSSPPQTTSRVKTTKEKEATKLAERRRRRRESHNAVERRRRDHINERIAELASLLPESMLLDAIAASTSGGTMPHIDLTLFTRRPATDSLDVTDLQQELSHNDLEREANALEPVHSSSETLALAQSKPNKGIILSKSVEYIKHLHEFCSVLRTKNRELQQDMDRIKSSVMLVANNPSSSSSTSFLSNEVDTSTGQPLEDSTMAKATSTTPPNLATWLTQYRGKKASEDAKMSQGTSSAT